MTADMARKGHFQPTLPQQSVDITGPRHRIGCYLLIISTTMKTASAGKLRSGSVTIKLDDADRDRIASLAATKNRTPHYLMKEAILAYVKREEARQNFIAAAESSYVHYKETGLHLTFEEVSAWADEVQQNPDAALPECHT